MPGPATKSGTPKLSEVARHVVLPNDIASTGWPAVRDKCLALGVRFDPWQDGLGRAALGKRIDGKYAAGVGGVVISIPRQVGKTFTVGAIVFALCILFPGLTVVWTAHRLKTAGETFRAMQGMARRIKIKPYVEQVFTGSGDEEIRFRNGSRILFGARERGFGRGFAEVDIEVFDEAQILTDRALDDMVPATNQSKQPAGALLFFIGTPPKPTDPGEAFTAKRAKALAGTSAGMVYVELSADPDANPTDRKQWAKANPSFPKRTPLEAMLRMQENLSEESFLREGLGIWLDMISTGAIDPEVWAARRTDAFLPDGRVTLGVDFAPGATSASIVACAGGIVELLDKRPGTAWVPARLEQLLAEQDVMATGVVPGQIPGAIVEFFDAPWIDRFDGARLTQATTSALAPRSEGGFAHRGQSELDTAVAGAKLRNVGDSSKWSRRDSTVDITPLVAATIAAQLWVENDYDVMDTAF